MTEHDCAQIEELLSAQMDGATTSEENARLARHLSDCADCQATARAFERVDREVRDYLRAIPVPAIGTPWREARRASPFARWRPATLALTTLLVLVVASILAFGAFRGNARPAQSTSAPQSAYSTVGAAPSTAASTAPAAAPAAPAAAPAVVPTTAAASGARATAAAGSASSSIPRFGAGGDSAEINPVQQLRLATATLLVVCQPDCVASPQGAQTLTEVVALLDRPLTLAAPATPTPGAAITVLRFTLADGQQVELRYFGDSGQLGLPDGTLLLAPGALHDVLTPPVPLP